MSTCSVKTKKGPANRRAFSFQRAGSTRILEVIENEQQRAFSFQRAGNTRIRCVGTTRVLEVIENEQQTSSAHVLASSLGTLAANHLATPARGKEVK